MIPYSFRQRLLLQSLSPCIVLSLIFDVCHAEWMWKIVINSISVDQAKEKNKSLYSRVSLHILSLINLVLYIPTLFVDMARKTGILIRLYVNVKDAFPRYHIGRYYMLKVMNHDVSSVYCMSSGGCSNRCIRKSQVAWNECMHLLSQTPRPACMRNQSRLLISRTIPSTSLFSHYLSTRITIAIYNFMCVVLYYYPQA